MKRIEGIVFVPNQILDLQTEGAERHNDIVTVPWKQIPIEGKGPGIDGADRRDTMIVLNSASWPHAK